MTLLLSTLCATGVPADAATKTPTTTQPSTSGCGATVLKANGTPWVCTLAEKFDGTSLKRALWIPQTLAASGFG